MSDFIEVASAEDFEREPKQTFAVEDRMVVVMRVEEAYYCIDDVCTHDGGPLGEGKLCDMALACPRHGAKFDIRTGKALTMPATEDIHAHEVKLADGKIYVKISE